MPVGRSWRCVRVGKILVLVASAALDGVHSLSIGSTADLHGVRMAIVALAREIASGVAVHTARMAQHGNDRLECRSRGVRGRLRRGGGGKEQNSVSQVSHDHLAASAAFTRSGVKGRCRRRAPVASKIALPIAAGVTVIAVSPAPRAGTFSGATNTTSTLGMS